MSHVTYEIVEHDSGWAYRVDGVYSETFRSHDAATSHYSGDRHHAQAVPSLTCWAFKIAHRPNSVGGIHSYLNAIIGSTRIACLAGNQQATNATIISTIAAPIKLIASKFPIP